MAEKSYIQKYREGLVESIKTAGRMLIDNAEDLAGKVDNMSYFDISISFDQEYGSIPKLTVTKSYYPPAEETFNLMDIYKNGKPEEKKTCENCKYFVAPMDDVSDCVCGYDGCCSITKPDWVCARWMARKTYESKECEIRGE